MKNNLTFQRNRIGLTPNLRVARGAGFSLIELMIVLAVVGVLAAIAIPSYLDVVQKARRTDAQEALLECAAAQTRRYTTTARPSYMDQALALNLGLCGADGAGQLVSDEGYYQLTIANPNCTTNGLFWCFIITATAVGAQAADTDCLTFSIDHTGRRIATPDSAGQCWRS